jgi:hypothetical protein
MKIIFTDIQNPNGVLAKPKPEEGNWELNEETSLWEEIITPS